MSSNDESDTDVDGCNDDEGIVKEETLAQKIEENHPECINLGQVSVSS